MEIVLVRIWNPTARCAIQWALVSFIPLPLFTVVKLSKPMSKPRSCKPEKRNVMSMSVPPRKSWWSSLLDYTFCRLRSLQFQCQVPVTVGWVDFGSWSPSSFGNSPAVLFGKRLLCRRFRHHNSCWHPYCWWRKHRHWLCRMIQLEVQAQHCRERPWCNEVLWDFNYPIGWLLVHYLRGRKLDSIEGFYISCIRYSYIYSVLNSVEISALNSLN